MKSLQQVKTSFSTLAVAFLICGTNTLHAAPEITGLTRAENGLLQFTVSEPEQDLVAIEWSKNLRTWTPMTLVDPESGTAEFSEGSDWGKGDRYYRLQSGSYPTVTSATYRGWDDALIISNGIVEAIVVPSIGRIIQFRFVGETDGPFWENLTIDGNTTNPPNQYSWGGDKVWPAPQYNEPANGWSGWPNGGWPPITTFDSGPYTAAIEAGKIVIQSGVESAYGVQVTRTIELAPGSASMITTTTFERVQTPAQVTGAVGIWVNAQLKPPTIMYCPMPEDSIFGSLGFTLLNFTAPGRAAKKEGIFLSLFLSSGLQTKIGTDSDSLLWMDVDHALKMDSPRMPGALYTDSDSNAQIYTNPNPVNVEYELLGPPADLAVGETSHTSITYTLFHREYDTTLEEANAIYGAR